MNHDKKVGVSVVVPVYNAEPYLDRCIKSLINQTYKNLEIILVDDGSTDGSLELCRQYEKIDKRITTIHQENSGQNAARKTGLFYSHGECVSFIDSDDWIESNMYESLLQIYMEYECDLITSGMYMDSANRNKSSKRYDTLEQGLYTDLEKDVFPVMLYDFNEQRAAIDGHLVNKIFKIEKMRDVLEKIEERITVAEDSLALYMYCLSCNSIYVSRDCFYHYDMREGTSSNTGDVKLLYNTYVVYQNFMKVFNEYKNPYILIRQLKPFILYLEARNLELIYNINLNAQGEWKFGFPEEVYDSKVVIYGAGICGQALYHQFIAKKKDKNIVAWVDKEGDRKSDDCLYQIDYPQVLDKLSFDYLLIAVLDKKVASTITTSLVENYGIRREKMLWEIVDGNIPFSKMYF